MEVCSRCHGLSRIHFRNLAEPGGPGFPEAAVKSLAATFQYDDAPNDQGKIGKRPGLLTDRLPSPYKNEQEARYAQNGALPPDLSLITKARAADADKPFYRVPDLMLRDIASGYQEGGADYVYAYITGYAEPPKDMKMGDFMNYNKAFPGHQTAMPNPFLGGDGLVKYDDGTPTTVDNYARDVVAFLAWAGDPRLEDRKRMGLLVMFYLLITAVLFGFAKRRIWRTSCTDASPALHQSLRRRDPRADAEAHFGSAATRPRRWRRPARDAALLTSPPRTQSAAGSCC